VRKTALHIAHRPVITVLMGRRYLLSCKVEGEPHSLMSFNIWGLREIEWANFGIN